MVPVVYALIDDIVEMFRKKTKAESEIREIKALDEQFDSAKQDAWIQ